MADEITFRAVAGAVTGLGGAVGAYHRRRAARVGDPVTRAEEPVAIRIPLRLGGLIGFACLLTWLVRPSLVAWAALPLPGWLRWAGAAMAVAAVPLLAWTFHTLGHNLTDTVATRGNSYLVTAGPYRYVRHPFYLTAALFLAGMSLLSTLWPVALAMVIALTLLGVRTPLEERKLVERFGDAYLAYMARTGRFIPRLTNPRPDRSTPSSSAAQPLDEHLV